MALLTKYTFILLFFINTAYASFLVEPQYHAYTGTFSAGQEKGDLSGKVMAINLGYLGNHFMIGFSIEKGQYTYDSNLTSDKYTHFNGGGVGSFIGFYFLDHFKIWTGYLNSTLEPTSNNDTRYFGQHVSLGIGYRVYEGLMLNLQGFKNQFTQMESDITGKTTGLDTNIKTDGHSLALSYILVF